ncbi:MAG TPA: hypothetical protein VFO83_11970, partial [Aggregicoccus sp.]|nr:hypothetical protein [Aggregicoccus sp.]
MRGALLLLVLLLAACGRSDEARERREVDERIGQAQSEVLRFEAEGGLVHVLQLEGARVRARAGAAELRF